MLPFQILRRLLASALVASISLPAIAYERDVHYGLTYWLALKAGFSPHEAGAIAIGNARVDSGGPDHIDAIIDYGCAQPDPTAAKRVQARHHLSREEARQEIDRVIHKAKEHPAQMLSLFGQVLHPYQDSWSHTGMPGEFGTRGQLNCIAGLALANPAARGGADSHNTNLTYIFPDDVLAMAKESYDAIASYPHVGARTRSVTPWPELVNSIKGFSRAKTKTQKRDWFVAEGVLETDFLAGITLPDGPGIGLLQFSGGLLPQLTSSQSNQYDAPQEQRNFFDKFFAAWLAGKPLNDFLGGDDRKKTQLIARLKLLKVRDHGLTAATLHRKGALTRTDLARIEALSGKSAVQIQTTTLADSFLPLMDQGDKPSALLPYVVRPLKGVNSKDEQRVVAITRLKHLPYDTEGWIVAKTGGNFKLIDVVVLLDQ